MIMTLFGALSAGTKTYLLCRPDRQAFTSAFCKAYCIFRKMRNLRIGCVNAQFMRKICARFSHNAQYMRKICARFSHNAQYMRKICARFSHNAQVCTFFLQCAIYAQDLCKIVVISSMCNICARFVQDCT